MRQITTVQTVLKFSELNDDQKQKVIEKLYDINVDDSFWYECANDDFKARLTKLGFYKIEVYFSGFSSQGDGASFKAKHRRGDVTVSGRYSHSGSMQCDHEPTLAIARRLADNHYRLLSREYDYCTSREAIVNTIEANEYEFDQDTLRLA